MEDGELVVEMEVIKISRQKIINNLY